MGLLHTPRCFPELVALDDALIVFATHHQGVFTIQKLNDATDTALVFDGLADQ